MTKVQCRNLFSDQYYHCTYGYLGLDLGFGHMNYVENLVKRYADRDYSSYIGDPWGYGPRYTYSINPYKAYKSPLSLSDSVAWGKYQPSSRKFPRGRKLVQTVRGALNIAQPGRGKRKQPSGPQYKPPKTPKLKEKKPREGDWNNRLYIVQGVSVCGGAFKNKIIS